ncbi:hypothetical protein BC962_0534 [Gillisia mitskevichiae]|uniref:Uncharacterized protein n=1 Tax=Gillisia mitskevichiae TaxID=270921 RepID=A0A495PYS7_9FLAO|nr:hypothetical protein [Gillisia mitskevichiae]RKS55569.1 hypothetical protein BC962_0534 [Gillisia mitskevichiae]
MKRSFSYFKKTFTSFTFISLVILLNLTGCKDEKSNEEIIVLTEEKAKVEKPEPGIVEVVTENMDFKMPKSIPSGWTTFKYRNQSKDTHFLILEKYPEGKSISDAKKEIIPIFQSAMDSIFVGKKEAGMAEFAKFPEWFHQIQFTGGTGLIAPGKIAQTTLNLEPGKYLVECYVKMNNGMFHSYMGMITELEVTTTENEKVAPTPTSEISISSAKGIEFDKNINSGRQIFKIDFKDQKVYPNFLGHDLHLVKISKGTDIKTLESWINWLEPKGLISPVPQGFEFLGGVQDLPAGHSGYFSVNLDEGDYAFIAEIPDASKFNMLKEFKVGKKDLASN